MSIFERAKLALGIKTNKELAEKLNQAESSISGWKSRDSIPLDYLVIISKLSNVSLDWIVKGENSLIPEPTESQAPIYRADNAFDSVTEPMITAFLDRMLNGEIRDFREAKEEKSTFLVFSILKRLKNIYNAKNVTELSGLLNVHVKTINRWVEHGFIPYLYLIPIAEQTGVSLDWLILGKGEMQPENTVSGSLKYDDSDAAWIPLYDVRLSAGNGLDVFDENIVQHIPLSHRWLHNEGLYAKDLVCAWIDGDSMRPTLIPTDIVVINRAQIHGDGVFAVRMGDVLRVKRLQWLADGRLSIISDNPNYKSETINPIDLGDQFCILGECHTAIGRIL